MKTVEMEYLRSVKICIKLHGQGNEDMKNKLRYLILMSILKIVKINESNRKDAIIQNAPKLNTISSCKKTSREQTN